MQDTWQTYIKLIFTKRATVGPERLFTQKEILKTDR